MPSDLPSIEDLISVSRDQPQDDKSAQVKFAQKQQEIKLKEIERATKKRATSLGVPYIDLTGFPIGPDALSLIKEKEARKLAVICFYYDGRNIRIATTKPESEEVKILLKKLKEKYFCQGDIYLISDHSFNNALKLYQTIPKVREIVRGVKISQEVLNKYTEKFSSFHDLQEQINKAQITEIVTMMIAASIKSNSSDIHIEAEERDIKVRFRIDGVLHDVANLDKDLWKRIISRVKILAGVKINIIDKPQDGRVSIFMKNDRVDIRASFLPTHYGESVVMRLLRSSVVGLEFEDLGLRSHTFGQLKREISRPNGMVITTGPTGSGKTTTLYAILKKLNKPEAKIITIEDPIEYQLEGVNQSQVSEKYTFAQGLRSIIRQDPDILMVGEIRDLETAEIAIQSALTGHLVLSTIHTNDAAGTIPRFLSMGAKPFLLAPALNVMIGQRLVRRICNKCKKEVAIDEKNLKRVKEILEKLLDEDRNKINFDNLKFYQGKGCNVCQGIGYKGRIGIYEIMVMNKDVEKLILTGHVSEYEMREIAVKNGMITMVQDGLLKAIDGITSVEEVFRVSE